MEVYQAQEWEQSRGFVSPAPTRNNLTTIYLHVHQYRHHHHLHSSLTAFEARKKFPVDKTLKFKRREELVSSGF